MFRQTYSHSSRNPAARYNPIASIPLMRPVEHVLGWSDDQKAAWTLAIAKRNVEALKERYASACAALGDANRIKGEMRRFWQAKAFRSINSARAQLRAARAALVAAEAAATPLAS